MCLILIGYQIHNRYPLILAGNRDEIFSRPTAQLGFWPDYPQILGGRDLEEMGTWFGITKDGRYGAVTNYREGLSPPSKGLSRGHLVGRYLSGSIPPEEYLLNVEAEADRYNGFNLLIGDEDNLFYFSNRRQGIDKLSPGFHVLSNHLLNTSWPKTVLALSQFKEVVKHNEMVTHRDILNILTDQQHPPDGQLPRTGVSLEWERILSPIFIRSEEYGTRSSSVLIIDNKRMVTFYEKSWQAGSSTPKDPGEKIFSFEMQTVGSI